MRLFRRQEEQPPLEEGEAFVPPPLVPLASLSGRVIERVRRILYVGPDGEIDNDEGPVELGFSDGSVCLLRGSNGWRILSESRQWSDPFAPPLSPENEQFVSSAGKWTAFDVSADAPWLSLVHAVVTLATQVEDPGKSTTVTIKTAAATLTVREEWDETYVQVEVS